MAGGIDWFRWHHGSVSDPKFQLVAKKAGASVAEVIAVWACLLEAASQAERRGHPGEPDFEAMDCALGMQDGTAKAIYERMADRGLFTEDGSLEAWERRQPKREDETAAERKRRQRERDHELAVTSGESRDVTQGHAGVTAGHDREEKSREEKKENILPGFALFWAAWPSSDRKQARGKCLDAWKKAGAEPHAALVVAHVERMKAGPWTRDSGKYVPAPLTYLNQRRWEGADSANDADPFGLRKAL